MIGISDRWMGWDRIDAIVWIYPIMFVDYIYINVHVHINRMYTFSFPFPTLSFSLLEKSSIHPSEQARPGHPNVVLFSRDLVLFD